MSTIKSLHQQSLISPISSTRFHISQIESALAILTKKTRTGKVVVTYEGTNEGVKVKLFKVLCYSFGTWKLKYVSSFANPHTKPDLIRIRRISWLDAWVDLVKFTADGW